MAGESSKSWAIFKVKHIFFCVLEKQMLSQKRQFINLSKLYYIRYDAACDMWRVALIMERK